MAYELDLYVCGRRMFCQKGFVSSNTVSSDFKAIVSFGENPILMSGRDHL